MSSEPPLLPLWPAAQSFARPRFELTVVRGRSLVAEQMLPDGVHDRDGDSTVFFLNQIAPLTVKPELLPAEFRDGAPSAGGPAEGKGKAREDDEGGGLLYVTSTVQMQRDSTVRR